MKFPRGQYDAIVREKESDRTVPVTLLADRIKELVQKEKGLNDLFWSLWNRGKCSDQLLSDYFRDERNAIRVRIIRMQRRLMSDG
jgi:hypothetical protein